MTDEHVASEPRFASVATIQIPAVSTINGYGATETVPQSTPSKENHDPKNKIFGMYPKESWVRWVLLAHSTMGSALSFFATLNYSSIEISLSELYGWGTGTFELFSIWAFVAFFIFFLPTLWLLNRFGVRAYVYIAAIGNFLGCLIRCFKGPNMAITAIAHISIIIMSITATGGFFFPPALAEGYFPMREFNLVVTISIMVPQFGQSIAYVISAFVMPDPSSKLATRENMKAIFFKTNYGTAAFAGLLCLGLFLYPKEKKDRDEKDVGVLEILKHTKLLFRNRNFYFAVLRFCFVSVNGSLMMIWPIYLESKAMSQSLTGNVLVITGIAMIIVSIGMGKIADMISASRVKLIFIFVAVSYFVGNLGLMLSTHGNTALSITMVSISIVIAGASWGITFGTAGMQFGEAGLAACAWIMFFYSLLSVVFFACTETINTDQGLVWVDYYQILSAVLGVLVTLAYNTDVEPGFEMEYHQP